MLEQLHTPRFVDLAPGEIYATLLDLYEPASDDGTTPARRSRRASASTNRATAASSAQAKRS